MSPFDDVILQYQCYVLLYVLRETQMCFCNNYFSTYFHSETEYSRDATIHLFSVLIIHSWAMMKSIMQAFVQGSKGVFIHYLNCIVM